MSSIPEIYRVITDMDALHEAFRDRVEDLNISRLELDAVAGLTSGYSSKLLADPPLKFVGRETLPKMLKGTGLAIALVVDDGALAHVQSNTTPRKYRIARIPQEDAVSLSMPLSISPQITISPENTDDLERKERMKELGRKGGKRRLKTMSRRARQRIAAHAARMRWAKEKEK